MNFEVGGRIKDDDAKCTICLEDYSEGDELRTLRCSHHFHKTCIDPWLLSRKKQCPLCQQDIGNAQILYQDSISRFPSGTASSSNVPISDDENPLREPLNPYQEDNIDNPREQLDVC
eukprot:TRINITY_DN4164_c0_g1_i1.p1 TRINITY_DN4164_c0_g1~~TRINITY_DN4164_c0_g1_i1.p1  ORF type:complete len:117 (+),score=10.52 TRINITY_DN4164_c0_g1_i1:128-478(+)